LSVTCELGPTWSSTSECAAVWNSVKSVTGESTLSGCQGASGEER
jgi:hypothetical protein